MTKEDIKKQVRQAFDHRVAVRVYNDQKIPKEDMDFILDCAWLSPSSVGLEPWRFIVLENEAVKKQLKEIAWGAQYQLAILYSPLPERMFATILKIFVRV